MTRALLAASCAAMVALAAGAAQVAPQAPPTAAQQRPVFRGGTRFVRVDAYPIQDGAIVEDLQPEDFEILEDGKPQKIESFDFIRFDSFTPDAARRDPSSQREGFDLAADPRYRVFVIFADMAFSSSQGSFGATNDLIRIQQPLVNFLDRILGPQDLYGFLTSRNSVKDLVLARKSTVTRAQIAKLWQSALVDKDAADALFGCGCGTVVGRPCDAMIESLKARYRADATYSALRDLVGQLGSIRQERKNVVLVTNQLPRWRPDEALLGRRGPVLPKVGITNGRVGVGERGLPGRPDEAYCAAEFQRLAGLDFDERYRQLLHDARQENVSFYIVTPGGLQAPATAAGTRAAQSSTDDLISLAHETDGVAIVNTNNLDGGMKRIADDLSAYYLLGYYTTNTRFDGGLRNIKVRFRANGKEIRARRQYRAPTEAEIAALSAAPAAGAAPAGGAALPSPRETALAILERANRPFAAYAATAGQTMTVVAELSAASIQAGRWKDGANVEVTATSGDSEVGAARGKIEPATYATAIRLPLGGVRPSRVTVRLGGASDGGAEDWVKVEASPGSLVGDPIAYRAASRVAIRPVAAFEFARNERIRVEWPVLSPLDRREVRLLDRTGKPLPVELPLAEDPATHAAVVEMSLSGLGKGDYLIELTAGAAAVVDRRLLAIRIK